MTSTTTTEATWSLNDLTEDEFEAFVAFCEKSARKSDALVAKRSGKPAARKYNNRDRLGRFVRVVHVDQLRAEGEFVNASDGTTHAHTGCGNLKGCTYEVEGTATGWFCTACVDVEDHAHNWLVNVAPTHGTKKCRCCGERKPLKKFDVERDSLGYMVRYHTCRPCYFARTTVARKA